MVVERQLIFEADVGRFLCECLATSEAVFQLKNPSNVRFLGQRTGGCRPRAEVARREWVVREQTLALDREFPGRSWLSRLTTGLTRGCMKWGTRARRGLRRTLGLAASVRPAEADATRSALLACRCTRHRTRAYLRLHCTRALAGHLRCGLRSPHVPSYADASAITCSPIASIPSIAAPIPVKHTTSPRRSAVAVAASKSALGIFRPALRASSKSCPKTEWTNSIASAHFERTSPNCASPFDSYKPVKTLILTKSRIADSG